MSVAAPEPVAASPRATTLCAIDALVVVGRHLGLTVARDKLTAGLDLSSGALEEKAIVRAAARCGLRCSPRRVSWDQLWEKRRSLPAIVRFTDGSSMVLIRFDVFNGGTFALLEDPRANRDAPLILDRDRFEKAWSGDVLFVRRRYTEVDESVPFDFTLIRKLIFRERRMFVEIMIAAVMLSFLALTPLLFLRLAMGRVLQYRSLDTLYVLFAIVLVLIFIETGFGAARRYLSDRLSAKVEVRIWTMVFNRMLRLPIEHFETLPAGDTLYRLNMVRRLRDTVLKTVFDAALDATVLVIFIPIMLVISIPLTAMVLSIFALSVGWILGTLPAYRRASSRAEAAETRKSTFLFQNLAGIRTVKTLALDPRQRHKWQELVLDVKNARLAEGRVTTLIDSVLTVLQRLLVIGSMAGGTYIALVSHDLVTLTTLFTFVLLAQRASAPLNQAATLLKQFDEARMAVRDIAVLVNQPEEEGRAGRGLRSPLKGHVEFVDLRFKYRGSVHPALRSISFDVPAGMTLGIMGRSGSGKTTITRLLQRLHSDYQGLIKVDGIDLRDYDVDYLRSSLGVVLQDNFLFSGTIRENITVAKSDASHDEVVLAAQLAGAEEFIDKLPRGYDTFIYEGSPNLSGGQRQRIAIARALITNPRLLILDEATSALDAESEAIVNANMRRIAEGRTMIVISHRLSTLVNSDAILVLDKGEIHDIGKHNELLDRCDIYSGLWYHQNPSTDDSMAA